MCVCEPAAAEYIGQQTQQEQQHKGSDEKAAIAMRSSARYYICFQFRFRLGRHRQQITVGDFAQAARWRRRHAYSHTFCVHSTRHNPRIWWFSQTLGLCLGFRDSNGTLLVSLEKKTFFKKIVVVLRFIYTYLDDDKFFFNNNWFSKLTKWNPESILNLWISQNICWISHYNSRIGKNMVLWACLGTI